MKKPYDNSPELQIQPWRNGIKLIKLNDRLVEQSVITVTEAFKLPCSVYFLNLESKIQNLNEINIALMGLNSINDAVEKTGYDLFPGEKSWRVINGDKHVIRSHNRYLAEEVAPDTANPNTHYLTVKVPWYDQQNKIVSIFGCSIKLGVHSLTESLSGMTKLGILNNPVVAFNKVEETPHFTDSELNILYHIKNGSTAREIAAIRDTSVRTVEHHIENIKLKLNVRTRSELIKKAFQLV